MRNEAFFVFFYIVLAVASSYCLSAMCRMIVSVSVNKKFLISLVWIGEYVFTE